MAARKRSSPGRPAIPREGNGQSRPGRPRPSCRPPGTPYPKSQFLSRSFESILPTSLTYILPSTRGCSPWRPAAVMGTTGCENPRPRSGRSPGFSRAVICAPDTAKLRCSTSRKATSPLDAIPWASALAGLSRRGENSPQGKCRRLQVRLRCRCESTTSGAGILTGFPVGYDAYKRVFTTNKLSPDP